MSFFNLALCFALLVPSTMSLLALFAQNGPTFSFANPTLVFALIFFANVALICRLSAQIWFLSTPFVNVKNLKNIIKNILVRFCFGTGDCASTADEPATSTNLITVISTTTSTPSSTTSATDAQTPTTAQVHTNSRSTQTRAATTSIGTSTLSSSSSSSAAPPTLAQTALTGVQTDAAANNALLPADPVAVIADLRYKLTVEKGMHAQSKEVFKLIAIRAKAAEAETKSRDTTESALRTKLARVRDDLEAANLANVAAAADLEAANQANLAAAADLARLNDELAFARKVNEHQATKMIELRKHMEEAQVQAKQHLDLRVTADVRAERAEDRVARLIGRSCADEKLHMNMVTAMAGELDQVNDALTQARANHRQGVKNMKLRLDAANAEAAKANEACAAVTVRAEKAEAKAAKLTERLATNNKMHAAKAAVATAKMADLKEAFAAEREMVQMGTDMYLEEAAARQAHIGMLEQQLSAAHAASSAQRQHVATLTGGHSSSSPLVLPVASLAKSEQAILRPYSVHNDITVDSVLEIEPTDALGSWC